MSRSKDDVLDEYYGLGEYSRRAFDPGSQFTEAEWLTKHGFSSEDRTKKSTGGRVKMAKGTKKLKDKKKTNEIRGIIRISGSDILNLNPEKLVENLSRTILEQSDRTKKSTGGLIGNQKKLDMDGDNQLTGQDFKMLRDKKSAGGRVKLSKGTPNPALMDATSNRATNAKISRGGGAAVRGVKFKGVF